jgi:hypothetical protein
MRNEKNSTESTVHDTDSYLQKLVVTNPLTEPVMRRAIHAACRGSGTRGARHRS